MKISDLPLLSPIRAVIKDERGSVEAGLTLIPLTILFLASQWANSEQVRQQSETNQVAISGSLGQGMSEALQKHDGATTENLRYLPLLGGGHLVISERSRSIPLIAHFTGLNGQRYLWRKRVTSVSEVFTR
jgi:hypothetical protein